MFTIELQKKIDDNWDACWPLSQLKPVIILDLISYLFFKKVSENKLTFKKFQDFSNLPVSNKEANEAIPWEVFKNLDAKSMHELFTQKNGIIDSLKNYRPYVFFNEFIKGDLLLTPTPKSLAKSVDIIKMMENEDAGTKAKIFEYLLNKTEIIASNGQVYLPHYIVNLIVSIIKPGPNDVILDPVLGNGSLLVGCAKYIVKENELKDKNFKNNFDSQKLVGFESDLSNRRIGAMNMLLNSIGNPNLKTHEPLSSSGFMPSVEPTVIVSNLIFSASENTMEVEGDFIKETTRKEIHYLNVILKNSKPGSRLAIVVPAFILYNAETEIKKVRQDIIDNFRLESIIYLEDKSFPHFFGAATLIFSREISAATDKVWLYKMKQSKKDGNTNLNSFNQGEDSIDTDEIAAILNHLKNKGKETKNLHGIYVEAGKIISNNYNLNYNEYKLFTKQDKPDNLTEFNFAEKKVSTNDTNKYASFVTTENKIVSPKKKSGKKNITLISILILALCTAFGAYWLFYPKKDQTIKKKRSTISTSYRDSTKNSITLNTSAIADTSQKIKDEPVESMDTTNEKYTVISKAYFYSAPNDSSRENIYINHWSNAVLIPKKEKDGFIYTVYDNKMGQILSGWLNKKDLDIVH
jgi:type I restriction enzyme M protein